MILYLIGILIFFAHMSLIDCKLWDDQNVVPAWLKSDWIYLGGTLLTTLFLVYTAGIAYAINPVWFSRITRFGFVLGSVVWDWIFGALIDNDPLYPFKNWYGGWGFTSKADRIYFDIARIIFAFIMLGI